jgi:hypothetical protein
MKQEETYRKIMRIENKIDELRAKQFEIVLGEVVAAIRRGQDPPFDPGYRT